MKYVLTTLCALHPQHYRCRTPPCLLFFIILKEVEHIRSDRAQISPGTFSCHAEENIKNTERRSSAHNTQYFLFAQTANSSPLPVPPGAPTVVVESGPVVYDDAAADEEDEEEEETCVSAMDLLGNDGQFKHTHTVCLTVGKRTSVQLLIPVDQ